MGVPRLKEIINVSKQLKTPGVEVHLKGDIGICTCPLHEIQKREQEKEKGCVCGVQDKAQDVIKTLEYTTLRSLTEYTEIVYDPGNVEMFSS